MGSMVSITTPGCDVASCWSCIAPHATYGCNLGENIRVLKNEWDELNGMKNDVKRKIDELGPDMRCLDKVQRWILRVEGMETQVLQLIPDDTSFGNCISRYKFGRKVVKMTNQVSDLKNKGDFSIVAEKIPYSPWATRYSEPTVGLETSFDEALRYIHDDQVGFIGLYGMGGVGKTTLLTKINNKLSIAPRDFDVIIWLLVSKNPSLEKLQEEIGKQIGYRDTMWTNKSQTEKANDIFSFLTTKKSLLLLDDIWERFDLSEVGVPRPNTENMSKVVFTTRSKAVCGRMGGKKVRVKCLARDEAWELFTLNVGEDTLNADPEIPVLAMSVAKKCGGLPLALITIGRAMSCKHTHQEWRSAISLLKRNTARLTGMEEEVFSLLKFSFDSLPSTQVRSCFLYCSLFPEDSHIPKHKLISYWLGEGYLDEYSDCNWFLFEGGYDVIGTLVHACLLEADENGDIKMHDVIRDMAFWIASDCGRSRDIFLVQARTGLTGLPTRDKNLGIERISLMGNHIKELKVGPPGDNLLTLLLNDNSLDMIGHDFFRSMPNLRVLDLSGNQGLVELPSEICLLVSLQYLNLAGTGITELPVEISELEELRYLDLTYTYYLHISPIVLKDCFVKLQVLKLIGCGSLDLRKEGSSFWARQYLISTLASYELLDDLSITIQDAHALRMFDHSEKLQRCTRRLGCSHINETIFLQDTIYNMEKLERLEIVDCVIESYISLPPMPYKPGLLSLRSVFFVRCSELNNLTWLRHASKLEILLIAYCKDIEVVINDHRPYTDIPFSRLKELYLIELPHLSHVHGGGALPFPCLKYIGVEGCPRLEDLALDADSAKECGLTIQGEEEWWDILKSKGAASFCLTDPNEKEKTKMKGESSTLTEYVDPLAIKTTQKGESSTFTKYADAFTVKTMQKGESSTSTTTSTYNDDAYLPHFKSFE